MANTWHKESDTQFLITVGQFISTVGAVPTTYGLTAANFVTLANYEEQFDDSVAGVAAAKAAAKAATQTRDADRKTLADFFGQLVNAIYANPAVTDAMIADAGLQPRDKTRTKPTAYTPTNFNAAPDAGGNVTFTWDANGNSKNTLYVIETQSPGDEAWTILASTTKRRVTFYGFAPGVEKWFRVSAQRSSGASTPSFPAVIYGVAGGPALQVAA